MKWKDRGYRDGMIFCTGSLSTPMYPKRDVNSAQDEIDYIEGYNEALADDKKIGFKPMQHYIEEMGESKCLK